jgi:hypothetical protein
LAWWGSGGERQTRMAVGTAGNGLATRLPDRHERVEIGGEALDEIRIHAITLKLAQGPILYCAKAVTEMDDESCSA